MKWKRIDKSKHDAENKQEKKKRSENRMRKEKKNENKTNEIMKEK